MYKALLSFLSDHQKEFSTYGETHLSHLFKGQTTEWTDWIQEAFASILQGKSLRNYKLSTKDFTPAKSIFILDQLASVLRSFILEKIKDPDILGSWNFVIDQVFIELRQNCLMKMQPEVKSVFYSDLQFIKTINSIGQEILQEPTESGIFNIISNGLNKLGLQFAVFKFEAAHYKATLHYSSYSENIKQSFTEFTGRDPQGKYQFDIPPNSRLGMALKNKETLAFFPNDELLTCLLKNDQPAVIQQFKKIIGSPKTILTSGVVNDQSKAILTISGDSLTENEIPVISMFANQLAIAMQNASLYQAVNLHFEQLSGLNALAKMVTAEHSISAILRQAKPILEKLLKFDWFSLTIKLGNDFHLYTVNATISHKSFLFSDVKKEAGFKQFLQTTTSVILNTLDQDNEKLLSLFTTTDIQSLIICPLISRKQILGSINLGRKTPDGFSKADQQLMELIVDQLSPLVENALLYRQIQESEARFRTIYEQAVVGITVYDWRNKTWDPNPAFVSMLGYDPQIILKTESDSFKVTQHPDEIASYKRKLQDLESGKIDVLEDEGRYLTLNGEYIWAKIFMSIVRDMETQKPIYTIVIFENITERKHSDAAILEREQKYRALFELSVDAIFILDRNGIIQDGNPAVEKMLGYEIDQILNRPFLSFFPEEDEEEFSLIGSQLMFLDIEDLHARFKTASGGLIDIEMNTRRMDFEDNALQVIVRDVTEKKKIEQELKFLGTHDLLTGLFNRNYFEIEMQRYQNSRMYPISMIIIDLDGLKQANDQLGHTAGDQLIKQTALVLKSVFRSEDMVARWGGDEFAILLPLVNREKALLIINRIHRELDLFNETLPSTKPKLSFSVGLATAQEGDNLKKIMKTADQAMYEEKIRKKLQRKRELN